MKNLTFIFIAILIVALFSCKKETVYKDVIVEHRDTVYFHSHDTVFFVEKNDSATVGFIYTTSYSADSSSCALKASSNCKNLPSNAVYTWSINGDWLTESGKTYCNVGFNYNQKGNYILTLNVYLPDKKRNYTASEVFSINTKKP
jgi:hypothetical protein